MANPGEHVSNINSIRIDRDGLVRVLHYSGIADNAGEVALRVSDIDVNALPEYAAFLTALKAQLATAPDLRDPVVRSARREERRTQHEAQRKERHEAREQRRTQRSVER